MGSVSLINGHIDDDVMTDEQIVKALEYCKDCSANLNIEIINLINRKNENIKELDKKIVIQKGLIDYQHEELERLQNNYVNTAKHCLLLIRENTNNVIKEFVEELNESFGNYTDDTIIWVREKIDDLVKEWQVKIDV